MAQPKTQALTPHALTPHPGKTWAAKFGPSCPEPDPQDLTLTCLDITLTCLDITPPGWANYSPEMASRAAVYVLRKFPAGGGMSVLSVYQTLHHLRVEILAPTISGTQARGLIAELVALAEMSLSLCDCGCGVDLTMAACGRDGMKQAIPTPEECKMAQVSLTQAIKRMRARTGLGVPECKEALIGITAQLREQADLHDEALKAVRGHATMLEARVVARDARIEDLTQEVKHLREQNLREQNQRQPLTPQEIPEGSQTLASVPGEKAHGVLAAFMSQKGLGTHVRCRLVVIHNGLGLIQVYCPTHSISYRPGP